MLARKTVIKSAYAPVLENEITMSITGVTITGAYISFSFPQSLGGGVFNNSFASLTLNNSVINNNSVVGNVAYSGGGIYNQYNASINLNNTLISNNIAENSGGGIYNFGNLILSNSQVSDNEAQTGAGIWSGEFVGSSVTLNGCKIMGNGLDSTNANPTTHFGGGLYNSGVATITDSVFQSNAAWWGAGIFDSTQFSSVTIKNSLVSGNSALYGGGGISCALITLGSLNLIDTNVKDNSPDDILTCN